MTLPGPLGHFHGAPVSECSIQVFPGNTTVEEDNLGQT